MINLKVQVDTQETLEAIAEERGWSEGAISAKTFVMNMLSSYLKGLAVQRKTLKQVETYTKTQKQENAANTAITVEEDTE